MTAVLSLTHIRIVLNHTLAHPIAMINKVKDLALILLISVLVCQVFIFCQKTSLAIVLLHFLLTHNR